MTVCIGYLVHSLHDAILFPGFLQVLLLSGATLCPIQQHCWDQGHELYNLLMPPCCCYESDNYKGLLNIMWVPIGDVPLGEVNHIVPLLPSKEQSKYIVYYHIRSYICDRIWENSPLGAEYNF